MKKTQLILFAVLLLFLVTRFYKITEIPPSLYWDEASIGYNAYSILKTGRDEWGEFLPIHFRAFGEFKLPVYIYSVAIAEFFFGLSEFAVRLPAVIFSLVSILLIYLLAYRLTSKVNVALMSAFLLSVSPWFFIFSRTGYEVTAGLVFYLLGLLLVLNYYRSLLYVILSTLSFLFSMYSYNGFRVLVPLTFLILLFFLSKGEKKRKIISYVFLSIFLFFIFLIPVFKVLIYDAGFGRIQSFTVFPTIQQVYDLKGNPRLQIIYDRTDDKKLNIGQSFTTLFLNYFSHFNPQFLIFDGDRNLRSQQNGFGQIYIIDLILVIFGILLIFKQKNRMLFLPVILFLLAPLPASLFKEAPHALRALTIVPFICLIGALGAEYLSQRNKLAYMIIISIYLISYGNYFWNFITIYPKESSSDWHYSYKQIYKEYSQDFLGYDQIIISNQYAQPYIFSLFYQNMPPQEFRSQVKYSAVSDWGFSTVEQIGKLKFTKIDKEKIPKDKSLLFVTPTEKIEGLNEAATVRNLDGTIGLFVYKL